MVEPDDPPARTKPLRRGEGPTTIAVFECGINGQELAPTSGARRKIACFWSV
ncbi:MAG TPA: hypothetical protein VMD27_03785 [Candidatus Aquilonibacter sp.]|nr:hypothetical protein [Candidatus Aquilonibacter sp.]